MDIRYLTVIALFLILTTSYVFYQLFGGNPLEDKDVMVTAAIIQKLIAFLSVFSMFSLTYGFSQRIDQLNLY